MRILILLLTLLLSGCTGLQLPGLTTPERPKTVYGWHEREIREPITKDGVIGERIEKELAVNLDQGPEKLTFVQRLGRAIGNLSIWIIVLIFIGVLFFPTTVVPILFAQLQKYKKALKQTVVAIDQAPEAEKKTLKVLLGEKQDTDTKKVIGEMKAEV